MTPRDKQPEGPALSRREREILDILYVHAPASVSQVRDAMAAAPSYSSVRTLLRILTEKGHVRHEQEGPRYLFSPTVSRKKASHQALQHVVKTFFGGSSGSAAAALLDLDARELADDDLDRLEQMIRDAREQTKGGASAS